ncbi:MAG TPA: hypothetical protein VN641_18205 [Urbifossiella sp.]|nr:hypothetical protein [Urbifossiella sp.]
MWHWIKHWLDWVMSDALPLSRSRPHGQALHTRYEKAGLTLYDLPVPWNADAVVVEAVLTLRTAASRHKANFSLRLPGREAIAAESLRCEAGDRHRLTFRLPVPKAHVTGELLWKQRFMSQVTIPVLTAEDFLNGLRLTLPTVSVRLGQRTVAAQTFVASQCKGLVASCVLRSPTALAPLADLGLQAAFRCDRTGAEYIVPASLSSSQLTSKEAVIAVTPPKVPKRAGTWSVAWQAGDRELHRQLVHGISARRFDRSLRVSDTRFVIGDKAGHVRFAKQPPVSGEFARLGPCFLIASAEPGMAGECRLQVQIGGSNSARPHSSEHDLLITDGPTMFAPGMVEAAELDRVSGFELRNKGRLLGTASLSPVPAAAVTAEGGFKPTPDFAWSSAADDELSERLNRLMNGG